jgi:ribosomal protein S18 acetylase RimI-like enzyme
MGSSSTRATCEAATACAFAPLQDVSISALDFSTTDTPPEHLVLAVDTGLDQYNLAAAPLSDVRPLAAFASDPAGRVVGGAVGRTWGRCCELQQLWVAPERRTEGVGSRLLQAFEARGRQRDCDVYYLTTLSFQAPGFYRKHGYAVLAEISGFPNGITKFLMHKTSARVLPASTPPHAA